MCNRIRFSSSKARLTFFGSAVHHIGLGWLKAEGGWWRAGDFAAKHCTHSPDLSQERAGTFSE